MHMPKNTVFDLNWTVERAFPFQSTSTQYISQIPLLQPCVWDSTPGFRSDPFQNLDWFLSDPTRDDQWDPSDIGAMICLLIRLWVEDCTHVVSANSCSVIKPSLDATCTPFPVLPVASLRVFGW